MKAVSPVSNIPRTHDQHGLDMAFAASTKSKDPSTKVGCYICDSHNATLATGRNGLAPGVHDDKVKLQDRDWKYPRTLHAEDNALFYAGRAAEGGTLYVTHFPCVPCATKILRSRIKRVVCPEPNERFSSRWGTEGIEELKANGVQVDVMTTEHWLPFGIDASDDECDGSDYC